MPLIKTTNDLHKILSVRCQKMRDLKQYFIDLLRTGGFTATTPNTNDNNGTSQLQQTVSTRNPSNCALDSTTSLLISDKIKNFSASSKILSAVDTIATAVSIKNQPYKSNDYLTYQTKPKKLHEYTASDCNAAIIRKYCNNSSSTKAINNANAIIYFNENLTMTSKYNLQPFITSVHHHHPQQLQYCSHFAPAHHHLPTQRYMLNGQNDATDFPLNNTREGIKLEVFPFNGSLSYSDDESVSPISSFKSETHITDDYGYPDYTTEDDDRDTLIDCYNERRFHLAVNSAYRQSDLLMNNSQEKQHEINEDEEDDQQDSLCTLCTSSFSYNKCCNSSRSGGSKGNSSDISSPSDLSFDVHSGSLEKHNQTNIMLHFYKER